MSLSWQLFRIICVLQILMAAVFSLSSLYNFFRLFNFGGFIGALLFLLMLSLAVLGINILASNYPDTPVTGKQKTNFNRLFLLNFLFLVFLFGFIFSDYRMLNQWATLTGKTIMQLPFLMLVNLMMYCLMLVFELIILYGLYVLRRELYLNFLQKKFEFEKD